MDDGFQTIKGDFTFGGDEYNQICISANGPVYFGNCPNSDANPIYPTSRWNRRWTGLAAVWSDMDALAGGNIFYRNVDVDSGLAELQEIAGLTGQAVESVIVITYYKLAHVSSKQACDVGVNFQYVIASLLDQDKTISLVNFGEMQWVDYAAVSAINGLFTADNFMYDFGYMETLPGMATACIDGVCNPIRCATNDTTHVPVHSSVTDKFCSNQATAHLFTVELQFYVPGPACTDEAEAEALLEDYVIELYAYATDLHVIANGVNCTTSVYGMYSETDVYIDVGASDADSSLFDAVVASVGASLIEMNDVIFGMRNATFADDFLDTMRSGDGAFELNYEEVSYEEHVVRISCSEGYAENAEGTECEDIDECTVDSIDCGTNGACTNTANSYECTCESGFANLNGVTTDVCTDIDECLSAPCNSGVGMECINSEGSYTCQCPAGHDSDGNGGCTLSDTLMFSVPAPVDLVHYVLRQSYGYTSSVTSRRKRATDAGVAEGLFQYGCWCGSLDASVNPLYGAPVDSIDTQCRSLRACQKCGEGAVCDPQSDFQIDYDGVNDTYSCGSNDEGSCEESICECHLSFATSVAAMINDNDGELDSEHMNIVDDGQTCIRSSNHGVDDLNLITGGASCPSV